MPLTPKEQRILFREGDPASIRLAIVAIKKAGYDLRRPGPHHLKIGPVNFFPTTGTITIDPSIRHPYRGIDAFLELVAKLVGAPSLNLSDPPEDEECYEVEPSD